MKQNYIPTINISSLVNKDLGSKESLKIIKKIEKACVEVGFFQVIGHGIDHKKIKKIVQKKYNIKKFNSFLSISDEKDYSTAFAIIQSI